MRLECQPANLLLESVALRLKIALEVPTLLAQALLDNLIDRTLLLDGERGGRGHGLSFDCLLDRRVERGLRPSEPGSCLACGCNPG